MKPNSVKPPLLPPPFPHHSVPTRQCSLSLQQNGSKQRPLKMRFAPPAHGKIVEKQMEGVLSKESAAEYTCTFVRSRPPEPMFLPCWSVGLLWHEHNVTKNLPPSCSCACAVVLREANGSLEKRRLPFWIALVRSSSASQTPLLKK